MTSSPDIETLLRDAAYSPRTGQCIGPEEICRDELIADIEGRLSPERKAAVTRHLGECAYCRDRQVALLETIRPAPQPARWGMRAGLAMATAAAVVAVVAVSGIVGPAPSPTFVQGYGVSWRGTVSRMRGDEGQPPTYARGRGFELKITTAGAPAPLTAQLYRVTASGALAPTPAKVVRRSVEGKVSFEFEAPAQAIFPSAGRHRLAIAFGQDHDAVAGHAGVPLDEAPGLWRTLEVDYRD